MSVIRIATRASLQARTQAQSVADALNQAHPELQVELLFVETTGDQHQDVPLHTIGGQGVFVKEVQRAVLDGRAQLAVHSAKDLPSTPAEGLTIGAFCQRRSPGDALIGRTLDQLDEGATIATGSVRRRAQLTAVRDDLQFVELRGNIQTRLSKIPDGGAIVMAIAALEVLDQTDLIAQDLPVESFVPAVGQGCVAVECASTDQATLDLLFALDHRRTRDAVTVERAYLATLGSGCSLPVGAHVDGDDMLAFLADPDAGTFVRREIVLGEAPMVQAADLARSMQRDLGDA